MFNDIIPNANNNIRPLTEASELFEKEMESLLETTMASIEELKYSNMTPVLYESSIIERAGELIDRLIEMFKDLIQRISMWLSEKLHITDLRLKKLSSQLINDPNIKEHMINAPSKIHNLVSIYNSTLETAGRQLMSFDIVRAVHEFNGKAPAQIVDILDKYSTYVPALSKYNGLKVDEIKEDLFGRVVQMKGINPEPLYDCIVLAKKFNAELYSFGKKYEVEMKMVRGTFKFTNDSKNYFPAMMKGFSTYFHANLTLITGLVGEVINIILSVFTQLKHRSTTAMTVK